MPSRIMAAIIFSCFARSLLGQVASGWRSTAARMRSLLSCASSAVRIRKAASLRSEVCGSTPARFMAS